MLENVLLLPLLFIIHDFEELIVVPRWIRENKQTLELRKKLLFGGITNTSVLAVGVAEELVILLFISVISRDNSNNLLYFSAVVAYTLHLFGHILFCFQYKKFYVPGIVTAVIQLPLCVFWIIRMYSSLTNHFLIVLFSCIGVFFFMVVNLLFIHKVMNKLLEEEIL